MWYIFNEDNRGIGTSSGEPNHEDLASRNQKAVFSELVIPFEEAVLGDDQIIRQDVSPKIIIPSPHEFQGAIVEEMFLTKETISEKEACIGGLKWIADNFPNGGKYQEIIDLLVSQGKSDYATFLLEKFGAVKTVFKTPPVNQDIADLWEAIFAVIIKEGE